MNLFTDQLQREVRVQNTPQRIVSLVPSLTEWLYSLGLDDAVAGITQFCVHPESWFRSKTRIGGTKRVHIEKVKALQPDLILASKEENVQEQIEALAAFAPVWVSDIHHLEEACDALQTIGNIMGRAEKARTLIAMMQQRFAALASSAQTAAGSYQPKTAYLIWQNPYMTVGGDTFIHDMLQRCGLQNLFAGRSRYPVTTLEEIQSAGCELLLLSTEPFPFKQRHAAELSAQLPGVKVALANGEMFSWYGSRLLHAPAYFAQHLPEWTAGLSKGI